ncbi:MAG: hypothetical protein ABJB47_05905 [Actinomycetota bacterium]
MHSSLFGENVEIDGTEHMSLQNPRLLKVLLDGELLARQGAMVAYQGRSSSPSRGRVGSAAPEEGAHR